MMSRLQMLRMLALCSIVGSSACYVTRIELNQDHCANNEGDEYCARMFADRPVCTTGAEECALGGRFGCVANAEEACREPCGLTSEEDCDGMEGSSSGSSGSESTTGESTGSETGSTGTTTGEMPCFGDEDCEDADTGGGIEYLCSLPYQEAHYTLDHAYISKVMKATKGKILPAAELMGIDRGTLRSRLQELGLYSTG